MTIHDKTTGAGGNRAYYLVRSKIAKGKDGHGKVVTQEREAMMEKLGYDPGPDKVAMHDTFGSHTSHEMEGFHEGTRAENTAESNKNRAKRVKEKIQLMGKK